MADLLECLIQIKGVADTPRRLAARLSSLAPSGSGTPRALTVARWMVASEARFAGCLDMMLAEDAPRLPALPAASEMAMAGGEEGGAADWQAAFATVRAQTARVLDRCSAEQLCRIGFEPSRGRMTVADLVALMLAHDTDCLGEIDASRRGPAGDATAG